MSSARVGVMTWKSHMVLGFSLAFALGLGYADCVLTAAASAIPDRIEMSSPMRRSKHREFSHEVLVWLVPFLALLPLPAIHLGHFSLHPFTLALGPLTHLFADALTPEGIRFLGIKAAFPVVKTEGGDEYFLTVFLTASWVVLGRLAETLPLFFGVDGYAIVLDRMWTVPAIVLLPVFAARTLGSLFGGRLVKVPWKGPRGVKPPRLPRSKETIRFEELAGFWLHPENEPKPGQPAGETEATKDAPIEGPYDFLAKGPEARVLEAAWQRLVAPYAAILSENGLISHVSKIFEILDREGAVPSVRTKDQRDRQRGESQFAALAGVTLAAHTVHVAEIAWKMVKERYPEGYFSVLPRILVSALAHDLGKLPSVSGERYVTGQHPIDGAAFVLEIMKDHPWAGRIAELVRRHHEAIVERTTVELAILIRADKEARAMELKGSLEEGRTDGQGGHPAVVTQPIERSSSGPPETREIPADYPVERVLEKVRELTNVVLSNGTWVAFSQPNGLVYVQVETLHQVISDVATDTGFDDPFFHSTERSLKKSCLQSFYDEFRKRGFVPEKLVSKGFYGNFFWVWNPKNRRLVRTFYVPLKAEAFRADPAELEARRNAHAILAAVRIKGVAPTKDTPP